MNKILFLIPSLISTLGINYVYAEPLDVNVTILESDGMSAAIQLTWNLDSTVVKYEIGCVSCMPSISEFSTSDNIVLSDITPFPNTSNALLYVVAYDFQNEIVDAKQVLLDIVN